MGGGWTVVRIVSIGGVEPSGSAARKLLDL